GGFGNSLGESFQNTGMFQLDGEFDLIQAGFTQAAGTVAGNGKLHVASGSFNFDGGVLPDNPVEVDSSALEIGSGGQGAFVIHSQCTFSGRVAAGQGILIEGSDTTSDATLTAAVGFENAGSITLKNTGTSLHDANLVVTRVDLTGFGLRLIAWGD